MVEACPKYPDVINHRFDTRKSLNLCLQRPKASTLKPEDTKIKKNLKDRIQLQARPPLDCCKQSRPGTVQFSKGHMAVMSFTEVT